MVILILLHSSNYRCPYFPQWHLEIVSFIRGAFISRAFSSLFLWHKSYKSSPLRSNSHRGSLSALRFIMSVSWLYVCLRSLAKVSFSSFTTRKCTKTKCCIWSVSFYGWYEGRRQVCCHSFYRDLGLVHFLPEPVKHIYTFSVTDVQHLSGLLFYYNRLVNMSLAHSKFIYSYILKFASVRITIVTQKISLLNILESIP